MGGDAERGERREIEGCHLGNGMGAFECLNWYYLTRKDEKEEDEKIFSKYTLTSLDQQKLKPMPEWTTFLSAKIMKCTVNAKLFICSSEGERNSKSTRRRPE